MNKEIDYIASRYKEGRFSGTAGWKRLGIVTATGWRRYKVAAAIASVVILTATATIIYREYRVADDIQQQTVPAVVNPLVEVRVIDFENAPLKDVVEKIESLYGVKVENIPADSDKYTLSLHYEGTTTDLIAVINDILGTQMTVTDK